MITAIGASFLIVHDIVNGRGIVTRHDVNEVLSGLILLYGFVVLPLLVPAIVRIVQWRILRIESRKTTWQFSVRSLLVATTIVAIVAPIIASAARDDGIARDVFHGRAVVLFGIYATFVFAACAVAAERFFADRRAIAALSVDAARSPCHNSHMPTSPAIQPTAFDHVTLVVADLEATRRFYVDLLGMKQVARPAFRFPGLWFQLGGVQIHATLESPDSGQAGWGDRGVKVVPRGHHFAFAVEDAAEALQSLEARGVRVASPLQTRPDGYRQAYVYDPDGHVVEIVSK
jgi:catechol 2,3-dioxygenase-like lactoylglutathione lyase family enzyme